MNLHFPHVFHRDPRLDQILAALVSVNKRLDALASSDVAIASILSHLQTQVDSLMATTADVQAALAANESKEATIIGLLQTEAQLQKDTLAQLTALQASGSTDPADLQAVVDKMTADGANMDAAIASVSPPAPTASTVSGAAATGDTGATGAGATGATGA